MLSPQMPAKGVKAFPSVSHLQEQTPGQRDMASPCPTSACPRCPGTESPRDAPAEEEQQEGVGRMRFGLNFSWGKNKKIKKNLLVLNLRLALERAAD